MKLQGATYSPAKVRSTLSSDGQNSPIDFNSRNRKLHRRRTGTPVITGFRLRPRKYGIHAVKASGVTTPFLKWKLEDGEFPGAGDNATVTGRRGCRRESSGGGVADVVSARKLVAGLRQLRLDKEVSGGGGKGRDSQCGPFDRLGFEPGVAHVKMAYHRHCNGRECGADSKDTLRSPFSLSGPDNGILYKIESSLPCPKSPMEGATKWDPGCMKTSKEVYSFCSHMKLLEDQQVTTVSVISALQAELVQSRTRIHKLEAERRSSRKKLEHFLRKIDEEKTLWRRKEHRKMGAIIDELKDELNGERRSRERMEIVNSKLVNELADAKLSVKQFMQDYEKERKAREKMEEVCNELAKEIGEDKAEVEALRRESMKIHEEVEEEKRMLQMAEVWREERVQMKLVDAKLILEEKYSQMKKVTADLETFLRLRIATLDVMEMTEAELILHAVNSINIQDMKQFSYVPPKSDDIFSVIEDIRNGEPHNKEIVPFVNHRPASHISEIDTASPVANGFNKNPVQENSNGYVDHNRGPEEFTSGWETVSQPVDQGSNYSIGGSESSVDRSSQGRAISRGGPEWNENDAQESPMTEISEVCSVSAKQSKQEASAVSKLWRSCPSDGEVHKIIPVEGNERRSNGTISNVGTISPEKRSGEGEIIRYDSRGQRSLNDSGNPHIARGMKGCIEWPRGIQKNTLKAKLLEARIESQKILLRHVLKQKS